MADLDALAAAVRSAPGLLGKRDLRLVARLARRHRRRRRARSSRTATGTSSSAARRSRRRSSPPTRSAPAPPRSSRTSPTCARWAAARSRSSTCSSAPDRGARRGACWTASRGPPSLLGVPVVGGHLTLGHAPALSASCTGSVRRPLRAAGGAAGRRAARRVRARRPVHERRRAILHARCATARRSGCARTARRSSRSPRRGLCHAARDVSMPGVAGSLLQMIEGAGCGATLDVERLPRPAGVALERWLRTFPSFGFLLAAPARARRRRVRRVRAPRPGLRAVRALRRRPRPAPGRRRQRGARVGPRRQRRSRAWSPQRDRHRLVHDAVVGRRRAVARPSRGARRSARCAAGSARPSGGRRARRPCATANATSSAAEPVHARLRQHREPVALPQPGRRRAGTGAPRRRSRPSTSADGVQRARARRRARRGRLPVEQRLGLDEHAPAHGEVRGELDRRRPRAGTTGGRARRPARLATRPTAVMAGSPSLAAEHALPRRQARAGLAARAAGLGVEVVEARRRRASPTPRA